MLAKTYEQQADSALEELDYKNISNQKAELQSKALDSALTLIAKYLKNKKFKNIKEEIALENTYAYIISQLVKTGKSTKIQKHISKSKLILSKTEKTVMVDAFLKTRFKNKTHAKQQYQKIITQQPQNPIALRSLGILAYEEKNHSLAIDLLKKLKNITLFHIFHTNHYDTKTQKILAKSLIKKRKLFK